LRYKIFFNMSKTIITSDKAAPPIGPYSQAVRAGNMLFLSGQVALDAEGNLHTASVKEETHQVMKNIEALLTEAGAGFEHIVKTTIFLSDMALFAEVNEVYGGYFSANFPARETVAVKGLPKNVNVEISVTAVL
jgi:2-iminobutanoate/2-iminopropanoate deaminase